MFQERLIDSFNCVFSANQILVPASMYRINLFLLYHFSLSIQSFKFLPQIFATNFLRFTFLGSYCIFKYQME